MRFRSLALLVFCVTLSATAATPPLGPAVRVSDPDSFGEPVTAKEYADIATNGDGYLAVWNDFGWPRQIYASRIAADGTIVDLTPLVLGLGQLSGVVWNGRDYVVVWATGAGVHVSRIDGESISTLLIPDSEGQPQVATNGNTILVVTTSQQAYLLDRDLNVIREHRLATKIFTVEGGVAVASAGDEYMILVMQANGPRGLVAQRIDAEGRLLEPRALLDSAAFHDLSLASDGTDWLAVWTASGNLAGQILTRNESQTPRQGLAAADVNEPYPDRALHSPSVAWRGSEYLLAYARGGWYSPRQLHLRRVDASGSAIGAASTAISTLHWSDDVDFAIRGNGHGAMIWIDADEALHVGLFDAASIATANPFTKTIAPAIGPMEQKRPVVQRLGGQAIVAWIERSLQRTVIRLGRIGETPLFVDDDTDADWIDLDTDGSTIWVTWYGDGVLRFRRYTAALAPIDASARSYFAPPNVDTAEAAAVGNGALLVLWRTHPISDGTMFGKRPDIVGKVVRADGSDTNVQVSIEELEEESAVAVFDGTHFFTAWRDHETAWGDPPIPQPARIRARRFTTAGDPVEAIPVMLWNRADDYTSALFALPSPQGVILAWDQLDAQQHGTKLMIARYATLAEVAPVEHELARNSVGTLSGIALLDGGELDVYWTKSVSALQGTITYERLTPSFASTGGRYTTPPFRMVESVPVMSATVIGTLPVLVHEAIDVHAAGLTRLFVRQAATIRRRAVR